MVALLHAPHPVGGKVRHRRPVTTSDLNAAGGIDEPGVPERLTRHGVVPSLFRSACSKYDPSWLGRQRSVRPAATAASTFRAAIRVDIPSVGAAAYGVRGAVDTKERALLAHGVDRTSQLRSMRICSSSKATARHSSIVTRAICSPTSERDDRVAEHQLEIGLHPPGFSRVDDWDCPRRSAAPTAPRSRRRSNPSWQNGAAPHRTRRRNPPVPTGWARPRRPCQPPRPWFTGQAQSR